MNNETVLKYQDVVRKAAVHISVEWPDVDVTDVEQDIWVRILESPSTAETLDSFEPDAVLRFMHKLAKQVAVTEKQKQMVVSGNFRYSKGEVKSLLGNGALYALGAGEFCSNTADQAASGTRGGQYEATAYADSTGLTATSLADLEHGMKALKVSNKRYFNLLVAKYVICDVEMSSADTTATHRAIKSLTDRMNYNFQRNSGYHQGGPGSRKAISNARAYAITNDQLNADANWSPVNKPGGLIS